ncbi:MAG: peptidylprolyl isomerase [Ilumatobacteraceae bacterium]
MGTEKRERQKANRQLKYEQQAKEQQRRKLTRTIVIGVAAVVGVLALVLFLALVVGGDDDEDTPATTTTVPSTTPVSSTPGTATDASVAPPSIVPFTYGDGPCPPAEVTEPVKDFASAPEECIDPAATYTARFVTSMGDIVVALDAAEVPGTVNNFVTLAQYGYYDDTLIFRTDPSIGILQGGGENNTQSPGYDIPDEGTGFTYRPGQLVMARTSQPNSAGGQWFFTVTDAAAALDAQGTYVVFGEVTEGLEITEQMLALAPASGDTPTETITVERVEITQS